PGEYLFSGVTSGQYAAFISAPGYTLLTVTFKIGDGPRQKSLFVPMKPKLSAVSEDTIELLPSVAAPSLGDRQPAAAPEVTSGPDSGPARSSTSARTTPDAASLLPANEVLPSPSTKTGRDFWAPHELEESVPHVDPAVACPSDDVFRGVGARMAE